MSRPAHKFRILHTYQTGEFHVRHYSTREARDKAAARWYDKEGGTVLLEFWSEENNQDELNEGWACDGAIPAPKTDTSRQSVGFSSRATELLEAVEVFVDQFRGDLDCRTESARSFACSEIDAFTEILSVMGECGAAEEWLRAHADKETCTTNHGLADFTPGYLEDEN